MDDSVPVLNRLNQSAGRSLMAGAVLAFVTMRSIPAAATSNTSGGCLC